MYKVALKCLLMLPLIWALIVFYYLITIPFSLKLILVITFLLFAIWALFIYKKRRAYLLLGLFFMAALFSWYMIPPSNERDWRVDTQKLATASQNGDQITLYHYRNFRYYADNKMDSRYYERTVNLSQLTSIDFYLSYWGDKYIAHTFIGFNFADSEPVIISAEARYKQGEQFNFINALFHQYELIQIIGSVEDLVGVRRNIRHETVYRYRLNASPSHAQALFKVYLTRNNDLAAQPEFYHLLSNNCTLTIANYARQIGWHDWFDIRYWLNGYSDRYLYEHGLVDTQVPFTQLREQAKLLD